MDRGDQTQLSLDRGIVSRQGASHVRASRGHTCVRARARSNNRLPIRDYVTRATSCKVLRLFQVRIARHAEARLAMSSAFRVASQIARYHTRDVSRVTPASRRKSRCVERRSNGDKNGARTRESRF